MKITYSIWQGATMKGHGFTADSMADIKKVIEELNSANLTPSFEAFISKMEAN